MAEQRSRVDRALALGGHGRGEGGALSEATKERYAELFKQFAAWSRSNGLRPMPASSADVAEYVETNPDGHARQTLLMAVSAIRWRHRKEGLEPPDGVPAFNVLGVHDSSRRSLADTAVQPVRRVDLPVLRAACLASAGGPVSAARTWAVVMLSHATSGSNRELSSLDVEHVAGSTAADLTVRLPTRRVALRQDDDLAVCPAFAVLAWLGALQQAGIRSGPLLRGVRGEQPTAARLRGDVLARLLRRLFTAAGMERPRPSFALQLGGALDARAAGASRAEVAERLGYTPDSVVLLDYLERFGGH